MKQGSDYPLSPDTLFECVEEHHFTHETVSLDGKHFTNCVLENCILEYCGGPIVLESTHFSGCRFRFGGEAAMTMSLLACFGLVNEPRAASVISAPPPAQRAARVN